VDASAVSVDVFLSTKIFIVLEQDKAKTLLAFVLLNIQITLKIWLMRFVCNVYKLNTDTSIIVIRGNQQTID
jgi:hypothetical protein